ncbi:MAG TPA: hypothetical protein VMW33_14200 [Ilumatobacteraceae bacterium]|nr:hypothetical protein [Ilumatobacteraceae bacterium]
MSTKSTSELSPTRYFWLRLALLGAGLGVLVMTHRVASRLDDSDATGRSAMAGALAIVALSLAVVGRSVQVIVTSACSDAYRVFRARHLAVCASLLFGIGAVTAAAMVVHDPFDKLFAHGWITAEDIVDIGVVIAALVCWVGAGVCINGAWDASRAERNWHHTLHLYSRRRI